MKLFNIQVTSAEHPALSHLHQEIFAHSPCNGCGKCCKDCADNDGYLAQDGLLTDEDVERLKGLFHFSPVTGFSSPDGCQLPLAFRPPTCVAYYCAVPGDQLMAGIPTPAKQAHAIKAKVMLAQVQAFRSVLEDLINEGAVTPLEGLT